MTVVLVVFVAAALVASALAMVVLWVEDRAIERACDRFDFDADDAPVDHRDFPHDPDRDFEAWMRDKFTR